MRASARCCASVADTGGDAAALDAADLALLTAPSEAALMLKLADYPGDAGARGRATWRRTTWRSTCATLAGAFHSYYAAERFLVDDAELTRARLALLAATAAGAAQRARRAGRQRARAHGPRSRDATQT